MSGQNSMGCQPLMKSADGGDSPAPVAGRWDLGPQDRVHEAHHRINNHLQLLASSLGVEARLHADTTVGEALLSARRRILGVARLHEQLQSAEDDAGVEMSAFLARLCGDLSLSFGLEPGRLRVDCEAMVAPCGLAVTLSMIVSELVTNAVKHAGGEAGVIIVVKLRRGGGLWRLTVADDGPGLGGRSPAAGPGVGLGLIQLLVTKLKGSMSFDETPRGASISVAFP